MSKFYLFILLGLLCAQLHSVENESNAQEQMYSREKEEWNQMFPQDKDSFPDFEGWKLEQVEWEKAADAYWERHASK